MASLYNYRFNSLTRIGDDKCGITERDLQNNNYVIRKAFYKILPKDYKFNNFLHIIKKNKNNTIILGYIVLQ